MPITLAQSKVGMCDKMEQNVIDLFRRESMLLDKLPFDNAVSPGTGGSTLTYGYQQLKTPSTAKFRKLNEEYQSNEAIREPKTAECKVFGGKFGVDRVIADTSGAIDEVAFQMQQKIKGAVNLFNYALIKGDKTGTQSGNNPEFDGLDKLLAGTETEYKPEAAIDLSTSAKMKENAEMFVDTLDEWLGLFEEKPDMLIMNNKMAIKLKSIARKIGYYSRTENAFGRGVDNYDGIPFYVVGTYYDGTSAKEIIDIDNSKKTTSIYAVKMDLSGFHGISPVGNKIIKTYKKDVTDTGVIIDGEVEAVMGVVLKNSKKAGVLRDIQVAPIG